MSRSALIECAGQGLLFLVLVWWSPVPALGDAIESLNQDAALQLSQSVIGRKLTTFPFRNHLGQRVTLADFLGKPLVISLVYTSCTHSCSVATRFLVEVVDKARTALGDQSFNVLTIGFDTRVDTPPAMAAFARRQDVTGPGWSLLSADTTVIGDLVRELGFSFVRSPRGFDHIAQATIVDAQGIIYRQVYGEVFETPLLVEPLKELVLGRSLPQESPIQELVRRVRLFCTVYDPKRDAYRFDNSLFMGLFIGGLILSTATILLARELRRSRRQRRPG
ncbi:MAG: SCO family protein [Magnetococcales bacterium]|nr:SCO family protein [Magnetococcales bacterium]